MHLKRLLCSLLLTAGLLPHLEAAEPFRTTTVENGQFAKGTTWYTLRIGKSQHYLSDNADQPYIALQRTQSAYDDADLWCFVDNGDAGYALYNKQAGAGKVLASSTRMESMAGQAGTGGTTYPVMCEAGNLPDGYVGTWDFSESTSLPNVEGYYMLLHGTPYAVNNFAELGKLAFWAEGKGAGSTLTFSIAAIDLDILTSTGQFTASNPSKTWHSNWTSSELEGFSLNSGLNNMTTEDDCIVGYVGNGGSCTYTLRAPQGYIVEGYSFDAVNHNGDGSYSLTLTAGTQTVTTGTEPQHIEVEGLEEPQATFVIKGGNKGVTFRNFTVRIRHSRVEPEPFFPVFTTPTTAAIPYRIPAIAKASNGDLIAVADYRHSRTDIGMANKGRIDLHARISEDNGRTWGDIFPIVEGQGAASPDFMHVGFGDPCIVADRESSEVLVMSCAGNVSFFNGTRDNHQNIACFYSNDNGRTWSDPVDIAESIYAQFDNSPYGPVPSMFIASGRIMQSETTKVGEYYRLYCVALVRDVKGAFTNFVLYSDDFGHNWTVLGGTDRAPIPSGGDEPKAEELPDGSILLSSRCSGGRYYNIYTFTDSRTAEGTWGKMVFSGASNNGVTAQGNSTNGEVLLVPVVRRADQQHMYLLLQSLPFGNGRTNVGIYYKELASLADFVSPDSIAANWDGRHQSSQLGSAYSTMCLQADSTIGFLYEEETYCGSGGGGYSIIYKNYSIEQITDSLYSYSAEADRNAITAAGIDSKTAALEETDKPYVGTVIPGGLQGVEEALEAYRSQPDKEHYEALNRALRDVPRVRVEADRLYRLRNTNRAGGTLYMGGGTTAYRAAASNQQTADQLFRLVPAGTDHCYYIHSVNFENYLGPLGNLETEPATLTSTIGAGIYRIEGANNGQSEVVCTNKTGSNGGLHLAGDGVRLVPWTDSAPASLWYVEPVDEYLLTMPASGYTTLCLPFGVSLPDEVEAYTTDGRTEIEGVECVLLRPLTSPVAPGQPMVVAGEPGRYAFPLSGEMPDAEAGGDEDGGTTDLFHGVYCSRNVAASGLYTLNNGTFRRRSAATGNVAANTAYFISDSEAATLPLTTTAGDPVGIGSVEADGKAVRFYDLNGRPVERPAHGIFVTSDGRKVLVK